MVVQQEIISIWSCSGGGMVDGDGFFFLTPDPPGGQFYDLLHAFTPIFFSSLDCNSISHPHSQ